MEKIKKKTSLFFTICLVLRVIFSLAWPLLLVVVVYLFYPSSICYYTNSKKK